MLTSLIYSFIVQGEEASSGASGLTQNQVYAAAAASGAAAVSADQTTIFIQSADGTEHVLVGQLSTDGAIQGAVQQGEAIQGDDGTINQSVQSIAVCIFIITWF